MNDINVNIRTDKRLMEQVQSVLESMGIDMTMAINLYFDQIVCRNRLPFELERPNAETRAAIEEAVKITYDPNVKGYRDIDRMFEEILSDDAV